MINADPITAAEMRQLEQDAILSGRVTGLELMEKAGQGVVEAIFEEWPEQAQCKPDVVVICGPGNNGGDGFVVARLLKDLGWNVEVYLFGDPAKLPKDARTNLDRWAQLGAIHAFPAERPDPLKPAFIIDAAFGTGLSRHLDDNLIAAFLSCLPEKDLKADGNAPFVISVDLPTGLCSDTGALMPAAIDADLTVTFHCPKRGHVTDRGPEFCGKLVVKDIGL